MSATSLEPSPEEGKPEAPPELEPAVGPSSSARLAPTPSSAPATIGVTDRACALGMTGSGKSTWIEAIFVITRGQRILIDVNDAYEPGPAMADRAQGGYCRASRVRDIDWRCRTVHFIPRAQSMALYNDLYAAIFDRGDLTVWLDESFGPTTANRAPDWLGTVVRQGRKRRIRHLAASQEPLNILPVLYSQAEHVALFQLTGRPADLRNLQSRFGLSADTLQAELDRLPKYGYLRSTIGDPTIYRMPPLPAAVIADCDRLLYAPN